MRGSLDAFLTDLADLLDAHADAAPVEEDVGEGNFDCEACSGCHDCRFCSGCRACVGSSYCDGCDGCSDCTHCRDALDLQACSHCEHCRACARCQYLTLCFDCEDCVQCFGCVGLRGAEFHVLNRPVLRGEYFETVRRLRRELEERREEGFRPAYADDPEAWFTAVAGAPRPQAVAAPRVLAAAAPASGTRPSPGAPTGILTRGQRPARPGVAPSPAPSGAGGLRSLRTGRRPAR